ncbi:cysteine synthase [Caldimicrobium thiodismutans]|uniref:cysteine synthase n=1 Tax=Caldimicrobium thiodismutans TaxID=1653476 RepID=A0A0U4N092_9BACT|nr:cysteine synthase family protein [Caldimicrobium thiodismutans]BAU22614.1 cysteine synthase [Caldimicrobium thiodismutans]
MREDQSFKNLFIFKDIYNMIGNTPLIDLGIFLKGNKGVKLYAKAEWYNPGGSVKDRPAREIILSAEREELLKPGKRLLDATSGNMGIAYTLLARQRGYGVTLCLPSNASPERIKLLKIFGAELILTDPLEGIDGAILKARELYEREAELYYYADQYSNPANYLAHYKTTGPEIWEGTSGRITHFVAGLGTGGTMMGVGRYLKEKNPEIKLVGIQPDSPLHGIEGLKHMPSALKPAIYDESILDEVIFVKTEEAYFFVKALLERLSLFVGISSGAALAGALKIASSLKEGVIVTLFPDSGHKYLSERFWHEL